MKVTSFLITSFNFAKAFQPDFDFFCLQKVIAMLLSLIFWLAFDSVLHKSHQNGQIRIRFLH